jgi:hypothetical protein
VADLRSENSKISELFFLGQRVKQSKTVEKVDLAHLEGTCRVSTMIIGWKKKRKLLKGLIPSQ